MFKTVVSILDGDKILTSSVVEESGDVADCIDEFEELTGEDCDLDADDFEDGDGDGGDDDDDDDAGDDDAAK